MVGVGLGLALELVILQRVFLFLLRLFFWIGNRSQLFHVYDFDHNKQQWKSKSSSHYHESIHKNSLSFTTISVIYMYMSQRNSDNKILKDKVVEYCQNFIYEIYNRIFKLP